jgi:tRNA A37 N6-isopentenylltransferase MiaA
MAKKEPDYHFIHNRIYVRFESLKYSQETLAKGRDQLILDTKHYCKRQITWIRNRIFVDCDQNRKHFFVLELSQQEEGEKLGVMERFDRQVARRAA